jgi:hypothetical protein
VIAQILPINANPYAEIEPIRVISNTAGTIAEGALPNAAIPAGKDSTPAPTMDFTRLKMSFVMVSFVFVRHLEGPLVFLWMRY